MIAVEQKNYDEESIASVSTSAQNETRDGFCPDDVPETSFQHALQERTFGFSFWPKVSLRQLNTGHSLIEADSNHPVLIYFTDLSITSVLSAHL